MRKMLYTFAVTISLIACDNGQDEIDSLNQDLVRAEQTIDNYKQKLSDLQDRHDEIIAEFNVKVSGLENTISELRSLINDLEDLIDEKDATIAAQRDEIIIWIDRYSEAYEKLTNPTGAEDWFVKRYPEVAANPSNLELLIKTWLRDAKLQGYHSQFAEDNGLTLTELTKWFRGEYGSRLDPKFDGEGYEAGGYAYYTTLYHTNNNHNGRHSSFYVHPDYQHNSTYAEYMLYLVYHEMGHAFFNYKHAVDEDNNVINGFDGHIDIMGYNSLNAMKNEDIWNSMIERYFDKSTQDQLTLSWSIKDDEPQAIDCHFHE